ncbi:tetratricopeptide repeat protein [Halodesulfovibrio aestuarii]|uniref:tetratricopeptide repeat protein n=1 Tax=Halodesulfovibrio aestuarii TaxID=126333 RepID=UPI000427A22D
MYRFISILSLLLLLSTACVASAQDAADKKGWIKQQITDIKVYPYKDKAYQYVKEGKLKEAAIEFVKALEVDPSDAKVRLDYCQVLYDQGQYAETTVQALEVLKSLPDNANALMLGASSLQKLGRNTEALDLLLGTLKKGNLTEAARKNAFVSAVNLLIKEKDYALLLNIIENEGSILSPAKRSYVLGLAYKGAKRPAEARAAYEQALSITGDAGLSRKDRLVALSDLADILMKERAFGKAQTMLIEAHAIDPKMTSIPYRLAEISYETKQYDKALQWIDMSLKQKQASTHLLLKAFILEKLGKGDQAIEIFDNLTKAATTKPQQAKLLTQKGFVAMKLGHHEMAIKAFEQSLAILPTAEAMRALATAQGLNGEWPKAVETYKLLLTELESGQEKALTHMQLGTAYTKVGKTTEAISELSKAVSSGLLSPEDQENALQDLGFLYYNDEQYPAARQAFLSALAEQPNNRKTLLALGRTQVRAGEYKDAIKTLKRLYAQNQELEVSMLLANAYEKDGQREQALTVYNALLDSRQARGDDAMIILERMATIEGLHGKLSRAGDLYLKAYEAAKGKDTALLLRAGESYYSAKQYDKALRVFKRYIDNSSGTDNFEALSMMGTIFSKRGRLEEAAAAYRKALKSKNLTPKQRRTLLVNLGYIYISMDKIDTGVNYMRQAIAVGGEDPRLRLDIGQALYRAKYYPEAIQELRRAKELGVGYEADSALSVCYEKANKPGLALYYLKEVERNAPKSVLESSPDFYSQMAYLYTVEKSYSKAITYYEKALCIAPSPLNTFKLGQVQRLSGNLEAAGATLLTVNPEQLETQDTRALYYEELGRVYKGTNQFDKAQESFRKAIAEKPNAEEFYLLGQAQESSEDLEGAIESYQDAVELNPADAYRISLGYAYYKSEKLEKAATIFEDIQQKDPDYINLTEDLAYINKQLYRNDASVEWFKKSIDNAPFYPDETEASLRRKIYDFKEEIRYITNRWDITGFYSYSPDDDNFITDAQGIQVGVLDNTAGVEVGYIPPKIGFRNGKIFEIIGRISTNRQKNGIVDFEADSTQGAVGLRYKPFTEANIALGVERLFKIGEDAEDNTLLRAMGSWDYGWAMRAAEANWNYTFVYSEFDAYVQDDKRTAFLIHGRQGWTWNIHDELLVTPHLYATYKEESPDRNNLSHVEGGPALSLRWLEGEDEYESYKREWEVLLRYTIGKYTKNISDDYNGLSVILRLNF